MPPSWDHDTVLIPLPLPAFLLLPSKEHRSAIFAQIWHLLWLSSLRDLVSLVSYSSSLFRHLVFQNSLLIGQFFIVVFVQLIISTVVRLKIVRWTNGEVVAIGIVIEQNENRLLVVAMIVATREIDCYQIAEYRGCRDEETEIR